MKTHPEHRCPKCKSRNIDYECNGITFDENNKKRITARGYCYDCDTHFEEHYLTEYQGVEIVDDDPWDGPMSAPVSNSSSKKSKATLKRVPHRHVYEYYRTCSAGLSPDAGMVWEEWRCNRNGCVDIIRRNERILEQEAWWNRD